MDLFKKYYLDEETINEIIRDGIIVFDTSALLDLYYYSNSSQHVIFDTIFAMLSNRLWIPAQVYFEFLKNKDAVSEKPIMSYDNLIHKPKSGADGGHIDKIVQLTKDIPKSIIPIKNQLKTLKEKTIHEDKYPNIPGDVYKSIDSAIEVYEGQTETFIQQVNDFNTKICDVIKDKITSIEHDQEDKVLQVINSKFEIGDEYSYEKQLKISREGSFRYSEMIPPGYEDAEKKIGMQKYGDLFAWKQILEYAKETNKSVLLIINDTKKDWHDDELEAPRYELLKEFASYCGHSFWTYNMKQFLYHMNKIIETDKSVFDQMLKETDEIEEVKNYSTISDYDFMEIINDFMAPGVILVKEVAINSEWRIIGRVKIFEGNSEEGTPVLVMVNITKGSNYTSGLHPLRNIFEVKKYYDSNGIRYDYYQFTITSTKEVALSLYNNQYNKKNISKLYNKKSVNSYIGFIDNGIFEYVASIADDETK